MRMIGTAATFLTATVLLVGCGGNANVDPAVISAINSVKNDPDRPDSDAEFMIALTKEGLIRTPDDFNRVGGYFAPLCMGYTIADDLRMERPTGADFRKELDEQYDIELTAEQWGRIEPAFVKMCADLRD